MPTHSVRGQNPEGEAVEGEAAQAQKRKQGGNRTTVTRQPPTPCETITAGVEQPTWVSQQGNPRRAASCMTRSGKKTAGVPWQAEQTHQGGSARAYVTPSRRRKKKTQHRCYRKKNLQTQKTGTTREGGQQLKPPRLVTLGEIERRIGRRSKKGNTKSEAQE